VIDAETGAAVQATVEEKLPLKAVSCKHRRFVTTLSRCQHKKIFFDEMEVRFYSTVCVEVPISHATVAIITRRTG
jgi:hypothetical protein